MAGSYWPYPGARWWKCDIHAHTPASLDTTAWRDAIGTPDEVTPRNWLLRFMEHQIDCVVIADHNSGAWIDALKDAYARMERERPEGFRELHLFPGVELSVNAGFHLLAVFDRQATTSDIDTLLGRVDYAGTKGDSDGVTRKSPIETIEAVLESGGLPIPAHADQAKGLLCCSPSKPSQSVLDANTLRQVFESPRVFGVEVVSRNSPKPALFSQLDIQWTEVLGSDCHSFSGSGAPGSRFTWVKMGTPSLEGLRLALLDGDGFSIRRSDDPVSFQPFILPEHFIEAIETSDARYMGRGKPELLQFSPWFNALVGGRGTGKSTVVHFLRLAYRRDGDLQRLGQEEEARRTFERFNQVPPSRSGEGGMLKETKTAVTLVRDGVRHRLWWSLEGQALSVEEEVNGQMKPSVSQSITPERFPVRIFSQGQIAALASESQEALLAVIDEAAETGEARRDLEEAQCAFLALRTQIRELDGRLTGYDQVRIQLADVRRKIARFEEAQHAKVLKEYQLRSRQEREMMRQIDRVRDMAARLQGVAGELVSDSPPQDLFDPQNHQDQMALAIVARLDHAVEDAAQTVQEASDQLMAVARSEANALPGSPWYAVVTQSRAAYAELAESLKAQGVSDPSDYSRLVQDQQRLESELARLDELFRQKETLVADMERERARVREARRSLSRRRQSFLRSTLADNAYVRMKLLPYGRDPKAIERSLRQVLGVTDDRFGDDILALEGDEPKGGIVADLLQRLPDDVELVAEEIERRLDRIIQRLQEAVAGSGDFGGHFQNYLRRECARKPELLDRLLIWSPEDAVEVEYSPSGDGRGFRPIGQASAGQRAAAMLAFLLAHGREPLVLDQPEDDLDNHLIYDLVVRQIRNSKLARQLIVVTHNPNVVVNGDAEMIHALDFRHGQCRVVQRGSLQDKAMREEICRVMEGGREAFERRYRRLGKEL